MTMVDEDQVRFNLAHATWALGRLIDACRPLTPAQLGQDLGIGPGPLLVNIAHSIEAMFFFADCFAGREYAERPGFAARAAGLDGLARLLADADRELAASMIDGLRRAGPAGLAWPSCPAGRLDRCTAAAQVFDHAALHRTQCINMLKRLGVTPVPDLDPMSFAAARGAGS